MNRIGIIILTLLLLTACEKEPVHVDLIDSYYYGYMHYESFQFSLDASENVSLEYDGNKIVRRIGGLVKLSSPPNMSSLWTSDSIHNEVTYFKDSLRIVTKSDYSYDMDYAYDECIIHLNDRQKMIMKVFLHEYPVLNDTFFYNYNSEGLLIESQLKTGYIDLIYIDSSFYYYNSSNNLDSIITSYYFNTFPNFDSIIRSDNLKIETFSDYDNAPNPLKHLFLFKETFYRSLSNNNYKEYSMIKYNIVNNEILENASKSIELLYDEEGIPTFRK